MPSRFGWVDFDEEQRQQMLDVVHLFGDRDTRDELGIGSIRDAFSDYFFPGTSTIQTRVRYMLFVPWIYTDLERKRLPSSRIADRARRHEIKLINSLMHGGEEEGVIGIEAKERLQRLPSMIYWSGLFSWGIRRSRLSRDIYHRNFDRLYQSRAPSVDDDGQLLDHSSRVTWDLGLPDPPEGFLERTSFELRKEDASYLQDRILSSHPHSLLALLVGSDYKVETEFLWEHPAVGLLPTYHRIRVAAAGARNFSETMLGASLIYNIMLAESLDQQERTDEFRDRFQDWVHTVETRQYEIREWFALLDSFWDLDVFEPAPLSYPTKRFVREWLNLLLENGSDFRQLCDSAQVRTLVKNRECSIKGVRARLANHRALELWGGASGDRQLDFRWNTARRFVQDINKWNGSQRTTDAKS